MGIPPTDPARLSKACTITVLNGGLTRGLWEKTAPPAPVTTSLVGGISVDVAIVGAGYAGLSAAFHLAHGGASVAVLEAETIGYGAAGRNFGLINAGMWVLPDDIPAVLGPVYGERLLDLLGRAPQSVCDLVDRLGIQCELERSGTLQCAVGERGLEAIQLRAEQWVRRGAPVEILDGTETSRIVGSSFYRGALFDKRTGTVQPLAYAHGLAKAAISAGAELYTNSPVVLVREDAKAGWHLRTTRGHAIARSIIVATDTYTQGPWPEIQSELTHLPYFNVATRPLNPKMLESILPGRQGISDTRTVLSSVRLDRSGRLIIGSVGVPRGIGAGVHINWAHRTIRKLFPQIGNIDLDYVWHGAIGMTDTHLPKFHRLAPRAFSISGYNGRGIAAGTVFGRLLAQLIMGEVREQDMPLPLTEPRAASLRSAKAIYYEIGAQAAHLVGSRI